MKVDAEKWWPPHPLFVRVLGSGRVAREQRGAFRLEGVEDVLEDDQAERDVLVVRRLKVGLRYQSGWCQQRRNDARLDGIA
jgi:hypothetical protein